MKKTALFLGLAGFFLLAAGDVPAAECSGALTTARGLAPLGSTPEAGAPAGSSSTSACAPEETFHIPAAVPLFLSAIAGLGIVAFRGKPF